MDDLFHPIDDTQEPARGSVDDSRARRSPELSAVVVPLMKGIVYSKPDTARWQALLTLQARIRDHVSVMGLTLIIDESEGWAFLRSQMANDDDESDDAVPRLIARRPLSFPVSLLLALLRKRLVEFDAEGADTRLILTRTEIVDLLRLFLIDSTNEAKLVDRIDTHVNKVVELGFLKKLKISSGEEPRFEVLRILRAFVDGQWLGELDERLQSYAESLEQGEDAAS
jgi:hypothetical protein